MLQPANIADYLLAGKPATRVCMQLLEEEHTYGELDFVSRGIAQTLSTRASRGDRVILIAGNSFFWAAAYLGIIRAGLVCVPLPPTISPAELEDVVAATEPRLAFVHPQIAPLQVKLNHLECFTERDGWSATGAIVDCPVNPNDLAVLMYTSGSTGKPRGVMVSHRNIVANTESIIQYLQLTGDDRIMTVLPFYYCFGASLLHTHLRVGGRLVIDSRFMYPELILRRMREARCTGFAGVPSHFQILLRRSTLKRQVLPDLRYVQQAGGHLAPSFVHELREALPRTKVFLMYGQTEATARLSYLDPEMLDARPGSIGKAIPGVALSVVDESGRQVAPGEIGEIVAEGENVTPGYWDGPRDTHLRHNGKLFTGDLATVDGEGYIYIAGRTQDILKCGGRRVSCRQVEDQLLEIKEIVETAVIPVPDGELGEAVKAFVVPRPDRCDGIENRIRSFCRAHLPPECIPREIVVLESLPKNGAGKVQKDQLRGLNVSPSVQACAGRSTFP